MGHDRRHAETRGPPAPRDLLSVAADLAGLVAAALVTAALVGCDAKEAVFHKVDGAWHYRSAPIAEADSASFAILSARYAKDARRVYYGDSYRDGREYFTVRHDRVRVVPGADAATFRALASGYAKDADSAYFEGRRIAVRDAASFEPLDYGFARDRVRGYAHQTEIPGSDGGSFVAIDTHYAKDLARVFHVDLETGGGAHPPEVVIVALPGAQPASFASLDSGYAKDAAQAYYRGRALTREAASFSVLRADYAKSATQVFYRGDVVAGADPASFAILDAPTGERDAADREASYFQGRRTPAAKGAAASR